MTLTDYMILAQQASQRNRTATTTYNDGVQCCRFCRKLMTVDEAHDHACSASAIVRLDMLGHVLRAWRAWFQTS